MKITTWNKLWSLPMKEGEASLARAVSIHPLGRSEKHRRKNKERRAKHSR